MKFVGIIERDATIMIDGYSNRKTALGAIKEMGRYIEKHLSESEGKCIVETGINALLQAKDSCGGYFLEVEDVPCACQYNEDTDECEYADGRFYVVCRFVK